MKKLSKALIVFLTISALAFLSPGNSLVGRWMIYTPDNKPSMEFIHFNKDGTYKITLHDGTVGETGNYKLIDSVFSIKNAVPRACGDNYWGTYKLTFHGRDSVSFVVIEDSCTNRRNDIVGGNPGLKRYK
jgi:hypothetical protein